MPKPIFKPTGATNPVFELPRVARAGMRELHPQDGALLLMHFAFRGLVVKADAFLAEQGLSRVHHRLLYAVARAEGISIGQLIELLGVTKQALHRPLKFLQDAGYIVAERNADQHRSKNLRLTALGARIEKLASEFEREAMESALQTVSPNEQDAWRKVMTALARLA